MPGCEWVDRRLSPLSPPADVTPEEQNGVLSLGPQSRVANALHRSPMQYLLSPHRGHLQVLLVCLICSTSLKRHFFPLKSYFPKHLPQDRAQN